MNLTDRIKPPENHTRMAFSRLVRKDEHVYVFDVHYRDAEESQYCRLVIDTEEQRIDVCSLADDTDAHEELQSFAFTFVEVIKALRGPLPQVLFSERIIEREAIEEDEVFHLPDVFNSRYWHFLRSFF